MTGFLASVRTAEEARAALAGGVDILDVKEPREGSLGMAQVEVVRRVAELAGGCVPVSATVGDGNLPPEELCRRVRSRHIAGATYVKIGLFGPGPWEAQLQALRQLAPRVSMVAVLMADQVDDPAGAVPAIAAAGFSGAMLDTADKRAGPLRRHADDGRLAAFVSQCRAAGLMSGLAGSLRASDIAPLLRLAPDYLGFRGALCRSGDRTATMDPACVRAIGEAIQRLAPAPQPQSADCVQSTP